VPASSARATRQPLPAERGRTNVDRPNAREASNCSATPRRQFFETPETCLAYLKYKSHTNAAERLEYLVDSGEVERTKHANDTVTYRRIE